MLKDITLGQYYPADSVVHRLDPRTKLLGVILFITALFMAKNVWGYLAMTAFLAAVIALSKVPPRMILKSVKPLLFIIVFTALLNIFYTKSDQYLFQWWIFKVSWEGLRTALFMVLRIIYLICGTSLLTYTTSPILLTDGIELALGPLKRIGFPVHELAMMMTIALRFIPTLIEETDKIMNAQKARGADFESGNLIARAKALIPVLVPLFVSAFRRADELAVAMECRCYHGGKGRTRMKVFRFRAADFITLGVFAALIAGLAVMNHFVP